MSEQYKVEMKKKTYIAGFDWIRLLGSMMIAFHHIWLSERLVPVLGADWVRLMGWTVSVFFMMSGYLMFHSLQRSGNRRRKVLGYCLKYGALYYAVNVLMLLWHYARIYQQTGVVMYKDFIYVLFSLLISTDHALGSQMWFIPPLIFGVLFSFIIFEKRWEKRVMPVLTAGVILYVLTDYALCDIYPAAGQAIKGWRLLGISPWNLVRRIAAQGFVYVFLGMWMAKYRKTFPIRKCIGLGAVLFAAEALAVLCGIAGEHEAFFAPYFCSVMAFWFMLGVRNQRLYVWHAPIMLFSGLNYFLHIYQDYVLLALGMQSDLARFCVIMAVNAAIAYWITVGERKKGTEDGF